MRVAEMNSISSDVHANEILHGQALHSLVYENPSLVPPFYVLSERARLIHTDFNQGAGTVFQISDIRSMKDTMHNTPPQVGIYTYRDRRRDETRTIEEWRWRKHSPSVSKTLIRPLSEEDQKENGKQPKPGKRKSEKPIPERKSDKGARRVKRPKVQRLTSSIPQ